jgi:hypothetical protein
MIKIINTWWYPRNGTHPVQCVSRGILRIPPPRRRATWGGSEECLLTVPPQLEPISLFYHLGLVCGVLRLLLGSVMLLVEPAPVPPGLRSDGWAGLDSAGGSSARGRVRRHWFLLLLLRWNAATGLSRVSSRLKVSRRLGKATSCGKVEPSDRSVARADREESMRPQLRKVSPPLAGVRSRDKQRRRSVGR